MNQQKMKALVWEGVGKLSLIETDIPQIADHEVLVKVSYAGMCATDVEIINGKFPYAPPYILGHEVTGTVVKTGKLVTEPAVGDRIVIDPSIPCGQCVFCKANKPEYCVTYREIGINENGGWAEYIKISARSAHKIPAEMSDISAAIFEPMACPFGAVDTAGLYPGEQVLIFGDGPAAMYFVQIARMMGAGKIAVIGKMPERQQLLRSLGADETILFDDVEQLNLHPAVATQGGFNLVIDAVGYSETVNASVKYACTGGRIILYGFKDSETRLFPHREIIFKGLTIVGKTNSPAIWDRAIACVSKKLIDLDSIVGQVVTPEEARDILLSGQLEGKKTIMKWS